MQLAVNLVPSTLPLECAKFGSIPVTYVVVDVLRASTTICTALNNGAREVVSFPDVDEARAAMNDPRWTNPLLCGERRGKKLPGFDLGNSPAEYTAETITGRTLIFASTNGSAALAAAPEESKVILAGLVNLSAVAEAIAVLNRPVLIACSGKLGQFALEDAIAAGALIAKLWEIDPELELVSDGAMCAQAIWDRYKSDPATAMWQSRHGIYLIEIGFGPDLQVCATIDSQPVVPVLRDGRLIAGKIVDPTTN